MEINEYTDEALQAELNKRASGGNSSPTGIADPAKFIFPTNNTEDAELSNVKLPSLKDAPVSNKAVEQPVNLKDKLNKGLLSNVKVTEVTAEDSAKQGTNNPTGIEDPTTYLNSIGKAWDNKAYGRGDKLDKNMAPLKDFSKITTRSEDQWGNTLPDNAYDYVEQMISMERAKGSINENTLKYIELAAESYYGVPKKFDISARGFAMTKRQMANIVNTMPHKANTTQSKQTETKPKPVQTETKPKPVQTETKPKPVQTETKPKPVQTETKPVETKQKGTQVANTNRGVAGAKVGDFITRSDGTTVILGQSDIDWAQSRFNTPAKQTTQPTTQPAQPAQPAQPTTTTEVDSRIKELSNTMQGALETLSKETDQAGLMYKRGSAEYKDAIAAAKVKYTYFVEQVQKEVKQLRKKKKELQQVETDTKQKVSLDAAQQAWNNR